jgi:hypothetical protein
MVPKSQIHKLLYFPWFIFLCQNEYSLRHWELRTNCQQLYEVARNHKRALKRWRTGGFF